MTKPRKVEEPASVYATKPAPTPPAQTPALTQVDDVTFRKAAAKVFKTRRELFRKLAQ